MPAMLAPEQRRRVELQHAVGRGGCVRVDIEVAAARDADVVASALGDRLAREEILRARLDGAEARAVVRLHRLDARDADVESAVAAIAVEQGARIAGDWRAPIAADLVALGDGRYRILLAAPGWSADARTLTMLARSLRAPAAPAGADETPLRMSEIAGWLAALPSDEDAAPERAHWQALAPQARSWQRDATGGAHALVDVPVPAPTAARLGGLDEASFLACWLTLLSRRFAGDAVVVACLAPARDVEGLADVVGPMARRVPVAFAGPGAKPLPRWRAELAAQLDRARELCLYYPGLGGVAHWRFGFDWHLHDRDGVRELVDDGEPHELGLSVAPCGDGVALRIAFDPARHSHDEVRWLCAQYARLLEQVVEAPERHSGALELVDAAQRGFVAQAGRGPVLAVAEPDFVARFAAIVARDPAATALQHGESRVTYAELDAWSNRCAHFLAAEGCRPGQRVGICLPRSVRQVVSILGVLKAGCAYVPIDPAYPQQRIARVMARGGLVLMMTSEIHLDRVSDGETEIPLVDWDRDAAYIDTFPGEAPAPVVHPESEAYAIFTSGSTGEPKGVAVSHRALVNYVAAIGERLDFGRIRSVTALSTVAADLGYTALFGGLGNGASLRILDESLGLDAAALADELAAAPVDCLKIVPSHLAALLSVEDPARVLPRECLVFGGEALSPDLVARLRAIAPALHVVNHYGPTETTVGIACNTAAGAAGSGASVPLGRTLANNRAHVLDVSLTHCGVGLEGDLYLAGDNLALGYLGQPAETAAKFLPDPFATAPGARMYASGDRALIDGNGDLVFRGRADQQVKLRGFRIELGEIEAAIRTSGIAREAVVVVRDDDAPPRLVAYVVGADRAREGELRETLAKQLPDYMQPAAWCFLERLPLNANGKLDRQALPRPRHERREAERETTPVEATLLRLCADLLGDRAIGVDDNFFAIGADSIVAIQLVARARQQGLYFRPKQIFEHQTIAALARVVETRAADGGNEQGPVTGSAPLSAIQSRFFSRVTEDPHQYNQAGLYDLPRGTTYEQVRHCAERLMQHHDALRVRFVALRDGGWRQEFEPWSEPLLERCCSRARLAPGVDRDEALRDVVARTQSEFDLAAAPLLRLVLVEEGPGDPCRLLAVAHHLVIDSYSWRVIEEDLQALLSAPHAALPAKTASARECAARESAALDRGAWRDEAGHWERAERDAPRLPLAAGARDDLADARNRRVTVAPRISAALSAAVHAHFNTNTQDFLLAALLAACADWTGQSALAVMLEGHGRDAAPDLDLSRTVGWFTCMYPVALRAPAGGDAVALLKSVKEQLRAVPGQGAGYAALRYLAGQGAGAPALEPQLCFNYLGKFGQSSDGSRLPVSAQMHLAQHATRSARQQRPFAIEVLAWQSGADVVLNVVYNGARIPETTMTRLCTRLEAELERLVDACSASRGGLTPSDVPDLDLEQHDLDELLDELDEIV